MEQEIGCCNQQTSQDEPLGEIDTRPDEQEPCAQIFSELAALDASMAQKERQLYKLEQELQTTDSRLDAASAKKNLTSLAQAKQKLQEQHFHYRQRYEETAQYLTQRVKELQDLIKVQGTEEEEKTQIMTGRSEILPRKRKLDKKIGDYVQEGITDRLEELANQNTDLDLPHLRQVLPHLTKDLDASLNTEALQRLSSSRLPFIPTKVIAIFFSNEEYSELRKLYDFKGFKNLETLRYDQEKFIQGLKCFGVKKEDIQVYRNLDKKMFMKAFAQLMKECKDNDKAGEKTLVLFSYGGHGIQDGTTQALTSTIERTEIAYNIEGSVRILSEIPNTYVIALFDCCREKMSGKDIIKGKPSTSGAPSRGKDDGGPDETQMKQDEQRHEDDGTPRNLVVVYGCKPYRATPANSKLTVQFFITLREMSDRKDKIVLLPGFLSSWKPNNEGEVLSLTTHDLIFPFDHTVSPECFFHQDDLKQECIATAKQATEVKATKQQADEEDRFMFPNDLRDTLLCFTERTGGWKTLQCYDKKYVSYTRFTTCHMGDSQLFQVGGDSTCQMLIPDPDPQVLKFTVEARKRHPYTAKWASATLIALPENSSVLMCGIPWDAGYLNPWCYNYIENEWNYKRDGDEKENSLPIPALPCARSSGSGCRLGQAVYLFCGTDVQHIDRMDLRTWSEWQQIKTAQTEQMCRFNSFVSPVNEKEVLIIGGVTAESQSLQDVYVFNTETNESTCIENSGGKGIENNPSQTALTNKSGQIVALDFQFGHRLIQVTRHAESGTASTKVLKGAGESGNQATHVPEYDCNKVLNLNEMKELTKKQRPHFDHWWKMYIFFDRKWNRWNRDQGIKVMGINRHVLAMKRVYAQHAGMVSGGDPNEYTQKELSGEQQKVFLKAAWELARQLMPGYDPNVPEPAELLAAKMEAIQSLSQGESTNFSWREFKRAYKMMYIWDFGKRREHSSLVRKKAKSELEAMKNAGKLSIEEAEAIKAADQAGTEFLFEAVGRIKKAQSELEAMKKAAKKAKAQEEEMKE